MRKLTLACIMILLAVVACKKDSPQPEEPIVDSRPPEEVVESITEELTAEVPEISTFTEVLKVVNLTKEEVSSGLTIFAPLDEPTAPTMKVSAIDPRKIMADAASVDDLTDNQVKDHLIKGVLKLNDLKHGTTLTTLSGKQLKVTVVGELTYINGILVSGLVLSDDKKTVFTVNKILSNTSPADPILTKGSLEVTIWDASTWLPENPKGHPAPMAAVALYRSQKDFFNNNILIEKQTDASGKVVFDDLDAGTYYIVATKDGKSNVLFNQRDTLVRGFAIAGIFQSGTDVETSATQPSDTQLGNFKWVDANADGTIDNSDVIPLPNERAITSAQTIAKVSVYIGYRNNYAEAPIRTRAAAIELFEAVETQVSQWHKQLVLFDGVLSDHAGAIAQNYQAIDAFQFNPSNAIINQTWNGAYSAIQVLNKLIRDIPGITAFDDKAQQFAEVRTLRAYLYLQLATYFGNIPLHTDFIMDRNIENSTKESALSFVISEFEASVANLPEVRENRSKISRPVAIALLAKSSLLANQHSAAANSANQAIGLLTAHGFSLASDTLTLFTELSTETIWNNSFTINNQFKTYFRNQDNCPYLRLSEIYLLFIEASINSGTHLMEANQYLNRLNTRRGLYPVSPGANTAELRTALQTLSSREMYREGTRFANLVRWNLASNTLSSKGYDPTKHSLLPIPQSQLDQFPNLNQNPNY